MDIHSLIEAARSLASDTGENVEYDRALVELVGQFLPGGIDHVRDYLTPLIVKGGDDGRRHAHH